VYKDVPEQDVKDVMGLNGSVLIVRLLNLGGGLDR